MTYHRTIQGAGRGVYGLYFGNPIIIGLGVPSEYLRIDGYSMDCEPISKKKKSPPTADRRGARQHEVGVSASWFRRCLFSTSLKRGLQG